MFKNYVESGQPLLTDPEAKDTGRFLLENTSTTVANTIRRCILSETRSVGFRADLTNPSDPGITIRKNTSVIFNEMLAHRLTLVPLAVRRIDDFDPANYQCVLSIKNDKKGSAAADLLHVTSADFRVLEKGEDGSFSDAGLPAASALFPVDPITKDACLIATLRPQWNPEQPSEEIDLTAYPVIGTGREFMGFCPVAQCSFENTRDPDPVRQEQFFKDWLVAFKKIDDITKVAPEVIEKYRAEWETMAIQRCFLVDGKGEPNSFTFTVESVGIRPVQEIVAEGIQAVIRLVTPYADGSKSLADMGVTSQPPDSRMTGVDLLFDGQEHTLGNLLQTLITELYIDTGSLESPIVFAGYKVRHPLKREMTLRLGFREGVAGDMTTIAQSIVVNAAAQAKKIFEDLALSWTALVGGEAGNAGSVTEALA
jgi:DNA-directed RNA polymerase subunit L